MPSEAEIQIAGEQAWEVLTKEMQALSSSVLADAATELALLKEGMMIFLKRKLAGDPSADQELMIIGVRAKLIATRYMIQAGNSAMETFEKIVDIGVKLAAALLKALI